MNMDDYMSKEEKARSWPEDFALENGQYSCRCISCKEIFFGHKRRYICKKCYADSGKEVISPSEIESHKQYSLLCLEYSRLKNAAKAVCSSAHITGNKTQTLVLTSLLEELYNIAENKV